MTIQVTCPRCQKRFRVSDEFAGRASRCTGCATPFTIPGASAAITTPRQVPAAPQLAHARHETPAPAPATRPRWWRFPAPATLLLTLVLFPLPWVEIACQAPPDKGGGKTVLFTQSGLQTVYGGFSNGPALDALGAMGDTKKNDDKKLKKEDVKMAPIMGLYAAGLLGGLTLGLLLPLGRGRRVVLAACCLISIAALAGQSALGFPLGNAVDEKLKLEAATPKGTDPRQIKIDMPLPMRQYTPWFYLSFAGAVGALAVIGAEAALGKRRRSPADQGNPFARVGEFPVATS
jgi:hypothetical protein